MKCIALIFTSPTAALVTLLFIGVANSTSTAATAAAPAIQTIGSKPGYSELKAQCLQENPALKGAQVRKCIKAKGKQAK